MPVCMKTIIFVLIIVIFTHPVSSISICNISFQPINMIPKTIPVETTHLYLMYNNINVTHASDFENFTYLNNLILTYNQLTEMPNLTFVKNTLKDLYLSGNQITHIPEDYFTDFKVLSILNMFKNHLVSVPSFEAVSKTLESLNFAGNNLEYLPLDICQNCLKLYSVVLNGNSLTMLPYFPDSPLETLTYHTNRFADFPNLPAFGTHLTLLNMYFNRLTKISPDLFYAGKRISTDILRIDLRWNSISYIPPWLGYNTDIVEIDMSFNPIICDSSLSWITSVRNITVIGRCLFPTHLKGTDIRDLKSENITNKYSYTELVGGYFGPKITKRCNLLVPLEIYKSRSIIECISRCMITNGCVFVNYKPPDGTSEPNCQVCSPQNGAFINSVPDDEQWSYYPVSN